MALMFWYGLNISGMGITTACRKVMEFHTHSMDCGVDSSMVQQGGGR